MVRVRGRQDPQVSMLAFVDVEIRIRLDRPLRTIMYMADEALADLSPELAGYLVVTAYNLVRIARLATVEVCRVRRKIA